MKGTKKERKNAWIFFVVMFLFILIPVSIQLGQYYIYGTFKGDWLGFWGNYLGFFPTGVAGYLFYKIKIDRDKQINLFNTLKIHTEKSIKQIDSTITQFEHLLESVEFQESKLKEKENFSLDEMVEFHIKMNESILDEIKLFAPILTHTFVENAIRGMTSEVAEIGYSVQISKELNLGDYEELLDKYEYFLSHSKKQLTELKQYEKIRSMEIDAQI
ncbi:hypothetical protein LK472_06375 [Leuconostoc lactis]|uniref:hypothetical protein n=1 Tax=Leuconostoc lactis TaxID=1246 RepID=UPI001D0F7CE1|nr:hypothetical protein [Leuconostoc lactis]MCC2745032.1 hypothetical protein [Leuconostoc lactis]MCC2755570.1 hypothetical protein [Leuconostoc lactis]